MGKTREAYYLRYNPHSEGLFFEPVNGSKGLAAHLGRVYSGKAVVDILRREDGDMRFIGDEKKVVGIKTKRYFIDSSAVSGFGVFLLNLGREYEAQRENRKIVHLKKKEYAESGGAGE